MRLPPSAPINWVPSVPIFICLFALVAYLPVWDAPFTFDDYPNIVSHEGAQPDGWAELLASTNHPTRQDRPVARLTLGLNYLVSGLDPTAYHLTNIAIHAAAAVTLFFLLLALCRAPRSPTTLARNALAFAALAALLWAVHPVNTQAVSYIVQRMASLAGMFYLLTLLVFVYWRLGTLAARFAVPLLLLLWALAVGSKLSAASAPAAWWLIEVAFFTGLTRRNLYLGGGLLAAALAGGTWATWSHLQYLFTEHPRLGFTGIERLLTETRVLWHYVSLIVWPDAGRLQVDYAYTASRSLLDPAITLPALLALLAVTAAAILGVWRRVLLWPSAGWLLFLIGSSVEASHVMLDPIFEQRIYLPGALLLPALLAPLFNIELTARYWTGVRIALILIVAAVGFQTVERNQQWASPAKLWAADLGAGKPGRAMANSTIDALEKGNSASVFDILQRGAQITDSDGGVYVLLNSARAHMVRREFDRALEYTQQALDRAPESRRAMYLHALNLMETGDLSGAQDLVEQLAENEPESIMTVHLEAALAQSQGSYDKAVGILDTWLEENEEAPVRERSTVSVQLAIATERAGDPAEAARIYRGVIRRDPQNWTAWRNLAQLYRAGGSEEEADTIVRYLRARGVHVDAEVE